LGSEEFAPHEQGERDGPRHEGERQAGERQGEHNGERRRRRGRRGGRRNRQRNGDQGHGGYDRGPRAQESDFAPVNELTAPPATEPELTHAVADLDAAPPATSHAPVSAEAPHPAPAEEPARRRSTVRERAPVAGTDEAPAQSHPASPAPEPVVIDAGESADADRPRRTGWWSRRFAGG
jgi:ribonuclease E